MNSACTAIKLSIYVIDLKMTILPDLLFKHYLPSFNDLFVVKNNKSYLYFLVNQCNNS